MNQTDMADLNIAFTMLVDKLLAYTDDNSKFNKTISNLPAILENLNDRVQRIEDRIARLEDRVSNEVTALMTDTGFDERMDAYLHSSTFFADKVEAIVTCNVNDLIDEKLAHYDPSDAHRFDREVERVVGNVFDEKLGEALEELDLKVVVNS